MDKYNIIITDTEGNIIDSDCIETDQELEVETLIDSKENYYIWAESISKALQREFESIEFIKSNVSKVTIEADSKNIEWTINVNEDRSQLKVFAPDLTIYSFDI